MSPNVRRGYKRLFVVMTFGWALFWALIYPLQYQWDQQREATRQWHKAVKNCDQLVVERPEWSLTKNCYDEAMDTWQNQLRFYSLKNFWIFSVTFWRFFVPLILVPPAVVYAIAVLALWVRRGFRSQDTIAVE